MYSNQFDQAFTIEIKPSLCKQLLIVFPHVVVALILITFVSIKGVTFFFLIGALACVVMSLIYFMKLHLMLSTKKSIVKIQKGINGHWALTRKNDGSVIDNVAISRSSFTSNLLIILIFIDLSETEYVVLITQDSVDIDEFRRLKVLIKTKKLTI